MSTRGRIVRREHTAYAGQVYCVLPQKFGEFCDTDSVISTRLHCCAYAYARLYAHNLCTMITAVPYTDMDLSFTPLHPFPVRAIIRTNCRCR